jgi:hypothetical protein
MGANRIALALKYTEKAHRFPAEAMGVDLVKVEIVPRF